MLIDRLAEDLGSSLRTGTPVRRLEVDAVTGEHLLHGVDGVNRFDAVVLAVPPRVAADLLRSVDAVAADEIGAIPRAPIGMVALAFPRAAFRTPPNGFGFLVAPGEDLKVLGTLVESNVFPHRAPPDVVLVRVIMGGADHVTLTSTVTTSGWPSRSTPSIAPGVSRERRCGRGSVGRPTASPSTCSATWPASAASKNGYGACLGWSWRATATAGSPSASWSTMPSSSQTRWDFLVPAL